MNGLLPEIKAEVKSRHPVGHDECMVEAQAVSDRNLALKLAEEELGLSKSTTQQQTDKQIKSGERKHRAKPKSLG